MALPEGDTADFQRDSFGAFWLFTLELPCFALGHHIRDWSLCGVCHLQRSCTRSSADTEGGLEPRFGGPKVRCTWMFGCARDRGPNVCHMKSKEAP